MMEVFHICDHCNREFKVVFEESQFGGVATTQPCPHCETVNHLWLRIAWEGEVAINENNLRVGN